MYNYFKSSLDFKIHLRIKIIKVWKYGTKQQVKTTIPINAIKTAVPKSIEIIFPSNATIKAQNNPTINRSDKKVIGKINM